MTAVELLLQQENILLRRKLHALEAYSRYNTHKTNFISGDLDITDMSDSNLTLSPYIHISTRTEGFKQVVYCKFPNDLIYYTESPKEYWDNLSVWDKAKWIDEVFQKAISILVEKLPSLKHGEELKFT